MRADGTAVSEFVPLAEAPSRATWHVRSGDVITSIVRLIRRLSPLSPRNRVVKWLAGKDLTIVVELVKFQ
ncbi:MAG: hypothetical protein PHD37_11775 [Gallionellaceae bacterium]|nr:hypothetical protein [Gallionellaceae bacterium]